MRLANFSSIAETLTKKTTLSTISNLYRKNTPITMMTAHDYPSAQSVSNAKIDICLIGDSLAMVALGHSNTTEITLSEMIHHSRAVFNGNKTSLLVGDLPFGSYEISKELALASAIRYVKEGKVEAVKMEGGKEICEQVKLISSMGIPVMGHIGLTPQRQAGLSGYKVQGKTIFRAKEIFFEALALQEAGAFSIVLEAVPSIVASVITSSLKIPTIGIGAGPSTSGQVLVYLDAVGMFDKFTPRFCKTYANMGSISKMAIEEYRSDVKNKVFPDPQLHSYGMESTEMEEEFKAWAAALKKN